MEPLLALIVAAAVVGANLVLVLLVVKKCLVLVPPNRMAVITGRPSRGSDGTVRGYRLVMGGRALLIPFLEHLAWMDLSAMTLEVAMRGVRVQDGAVTVEGAASVKVTDGPTVHGAIERFLGHPRKDIEEVALQTLESAVRRVAPRFNLTALRDGPEALTRSACEEVEPEVSKLGLRLDTLALRVELPRGEAPGTVPAEPAETVSNGSPPWASKG